MPCILPILTHILFGKISYIRENIDFMESLYVNHIAELMSVAPWRVEHCVELIAEGATVPFISRYRKERTGGLDEAQVAEIKHYSAKFEELEKRKMSVLETIASQEKLTPELEKRIRECLDPVALEDLYLPYRPKRRTRASVAKEKGLEPLAAAVFACKVKDPAVEAGKFLNDAVPSSEEALSGARDIMAEWISESVPVREMMRRSYSKYGRLSAKVAQGVDEESEEASKYRNYFNFSEDISRAPSHRVLAVLRGAREGVLSVKVDVDKDRTLDRIYSSVLRGKPSPSDAVALEIDYAVEDSFKRLLHPSIENETLKAAKERADIESIRVFGDNLRQLLMAPPLGQKRVLAIDPGFRTGCKVVCLDAQGALLHNDTIYPHPPRNERTMAMKKVSNMVETYKIEVIAIGNGTAGRETEAFIKKIALPEGVRVYSVIGLFGLAGGTGGVSGVRCDRAWSRVHRTAHNGPAGRAGEDRPQVDRSGAVPARCGSGAFERTSGRGGGELRQQCGGQSQYRFPAPAGIRLRCRPCYGPQYRGVPGRARGLCIAP